MPTIEMVDIDLLKASPNQTRTHPEKQIHQIADSIAAFGFLVSVLTDLNGTIVAGHGRWKASKLRGLKQTLVADAIKDVTRRRDVVLDTFCGAGTTILAAERVGRRAFALEIEPQFVDVAIRRWQAFTRQDAIHLETGLSFDEVESKRPAAHNDAR